MAFPAYTQGLAVIDARRNAHRDRRALLHASFAAAFFAGLLGNFPSTTAGRTEHALLDASKERLCNARDLAGATALGTGFHVRAFFCAVACAVITRDELFYFERALAFNNDILQRQRNLHLQIAAFFCLLLRALPAKQIPEHIGKSTHVALLESAEIKSPESLSASKSSLCTGFAKLIVALSLLGIAERLVRFVHFFKALFFGFIPFVFIGVELFTHLAIRRFDIVLRRRFGNAKNFVKIASHRAIS